MHDHVKYMTTIMPQQIYTMIMHACTRIAHAHCFSLQLLICTSMWMVRRSRAVEVDTPLALIKSMFTNKLLAITCDDVYATLINCQPNGTSEGSAIFTAQPTPTQKMGQEYVCA